ncbi:MAG: hypothetical protein ACR2HS_02415 [Gammaproteobacteria bacterium]
MSSISQTLEINYELDREEIDLVVINELQDYVRLLHEFLSDPDHYEEEERHERLEDVIHLKAVLRMYMDRDEYKEFLQEVER